MHCIVPFAAPASEAGRAALATMQWPRLSALLPRMAQLERDEGDATSYTPPHERVLARALGWAPPEGAEGAEGAEGGEGVDRTDGRWPFAAHWARGDGIDPGPAAWGLVSPVHWHVGTDQVSVADPQQLQLPEPASRALFEAVAPLFADVGMKFVFGHTTRWYVAHESLHGLRTASLDRVVGRNVDPWLIDGPSRDARDASGEASAAALRPWRRLQAEVQMLLHSHPLNAAREAAGLLPVNSFWLSGCGRTQAAPAPDAPPLHIETSLRAAALAEDWALWADAWRRFEESTLLGLELAMRRGSNVWLTLAGERAAVTFAPLRGGIVTRLKSLLTRPSVPALLASL